VKTKEEGRIMNEETKPRREDCNHVIADNAARAAHQGLAGLMKNLTEPPNIEASPTWPLVLTKEELTELQALHAQWLRSGLTVQQGERIVNLLPQLLAAAERERERDEFFGNSTLPSMQRLWQKFCAERAVQAALRARIDRLTEYLRHGPNCPADAVRRVGMIPRQCDCGLAELMASEGQALDGRALTSAATGRPDGWTENNLPAGATPGTPPSAGLTTETDGGHRPPLQQKETT
jgi:hypothetical protein